jgi:hypothetical protein
MGRTMAMLKRLIKTIEIALAADIAGTSNDFAF